MSRKTEEDIKKLSQAMDALAKLFIEKRQDGTQLQLEYQHKLEKLNSFVTMMLGMNETETGIGYELDSKQLEVLLRNDIEIIEKETRAADPNNPNQLQKYALIPIAFPPSNKNNINSNKRKKKKKNKIACSFCNEPGHTRAKCEKKLLHSKE